MNELISELSFCVESERTNTRLLHRVKAFATSLEDGPRAAIENLDDAYDASVDDGQYHVALKEMERVLGYLEGLNESFQQPQESHLDAELAPRFSLKKEDKQRVLELCSEMRKIVLATEIFDQPHKRRLLNRIAGIEHQVEQPDGLLDIVRAGVSDVGETLGKFGKDIEPLTKRMKEVSQIARAGSKEYDQIPAPDEVKRLPAPDEESEE